MGIVKGKVGGGFHCIPSGERPHSVTAKDRVRSRMAFDQHVKQCHATDVISIRENGNWTFGRDTLVDRGAENIPNG